MRITRSAKNHPVQILIAAGILLFGPLLACRMQQLPSQQLPAPPADPSAAASQPWAEGIERVRPAKPLLVRLLHTRLAVVPIWEKQEVDGQAWLTMTPYFYATDTVAIDARGFLIREVALETVSGRKPLTFAYDSNRIRIQLNRFYHRSDTFTLFISYIARPNQLVERGSAVISSNRGLYFINPMGRNPFVPRQLWTQGETEYSSAWFPTLDQPNAKTTLDLLVTVDDTLTTLSNGLLVSTVRHDHGMRTDHWRLDLPFTPYLTVLVVGTFAKVCDVWRNINVCYYVEKDYALHARAIFGNTPEMMEFYSQVLNYPYPWPKYSQVVVRQFVSGAMENVTATIHGQFLHQTRRELLDGTHEDVIAHELVHHWFGNVVTTESWAHLALNESFATYGEYWWNDYKYGREAADFTAEQDLRRYLSHAANFRKPLVRYNYEHADDVFDAVSYSKGARILHMLRDYVGDEAFFASLHLFLKQHAFQAAEADQLRLAFEQITGWDLKWFFDQWFFAAGHPELHIAWRWQSDSGYVEVDIAQIQDEQTGLPVYRLPFAVDIYANGGRQRYWAEVHQRHQRFLFPAPGKPDLVNVDANKVWLCRKTVEQSDSAFAFQYRNAPLFKDRLEAIEHFAGRATHPLARSILLEALQDRHADIREKAIKALAADRSDSVAARRLRMLALADPQSTVRATALKSVLRWNDPQDQSLIDLCLEDSSYLVVATALDELARRDLQQACTRAGHYEAERSQILIATLCELYSSCAGVDKWLYLKRHVLGADNYHRIVRLQHTAQFVERHMEDTLVVADFIGLLSDLLHDENRWLYTYHLVRMLVTVKENLAKKMEQVYEATDDLRTSIADNNRWAGAWAKLVARIDVELAQVKTKTTDSRILHLLNY